MAGLVNELITYGVIAVNAASPVQSCNDNDVILEYKGPTYVISSSKKEALIYKRKGIVNFDKKKMLTGGYKNQK